MTKRKLSQYCICVHPYTSSDSDGVPVVYQEGTRLEASDPAVKRHPEFWAADNDLEEIARRREEAWAGVGAPRSAPR